MKRQDFNLYLENLFGKDFLQKARTVDPVMPNGLQLAGSKEIKKIVTGVSLNQALIRKALAVKADTLIVHHALDLRFAYHLIPTYQAARLRLLLANNFNLYGYHYALDAHLEYGNNAQLAKKLNATLVKPYIDEWGYIADLPAVMDLSTLQEKLEKFFDHSIYLIDGGKKKIKRLGICSGRGVPDPSNLPEILENQVDVHITGEVSEWTVQQFKEMGVNYMAGGHYATERLGIESLTAKINQDLKDQLKIEFIDVPNDI